MLVRGYFIRHLKRGVLTDKVYLTPPSEALMREVCGDEAFAAGLVRLAHTTVDYPEDAELEPASPPPPPSPPGSETGTKFKIVVGGTGTVTPPK